jgi:hypothetical protein
MDRKPARFELRLPPQLGDEIDRWRREQPDLPPRAEAARRLIELGLKATEAAVLKVLVAAPDPKQFGSEVEFFAAYGEWEQQARAISGPPKAA